MACYRLAATRITQPCASAVEDACHSQTFFVDEVLDVPAVNERVFLQALAKLLELPWWNADSDQPQDRSLRRYLPPVTDSMIPSPNQSRPMPALSGDPPLPPQ